MCICCAFRDKDALRQGEPQEPSKQTGPKGSWKHEDRGKGSQVFLTHGALVPLQFMYVISTTKEIANSFIR